MTPEEGASKRHAAERYLVFMNFSSDRLMLLKKKIAHVIEARKYTPFFKTALPGNMQRMKMCFENKHSQMV